MRFVNNVEYFQRSINSDEHLPSEFILIVNRDMDMAEPMSAVIILIEGYHGFAQTHTMQELGELVSRLGPDASWQGECYRAASEIMSSL